MADRARLERLTARWRRRRDLRRPPLDRRPAASPEREAIAARSFPYRETTPAAYVARHGAAMTAFTFDDERYADAALDAWVVEVGRRLREGRAP